MPLDSFLFYRRKMPRFSAFILYIRCLVGYNRLVTEIITKGDTNYGSH